MNDVIKVRMADLAVTDKPATLVTLGLGSCVGICLIDSATKVAAMAHIMLPDSKSARNVTNTAKFADTAIAIMVDKMLSLGAKQTRMIAKIAGGAQMFSLNRQIELLNIGARNADTVRNVLKEMKISLVADETGGNFGRSIEFDSVTGKMRIKTVGREVKEV